jgi:hypothetical protein
MNDAALVGVMHRVADLQKELQPLPQCPPALPAKLDDRDAPHVLHDEVGPAVIGRARIEHPGDGRMLHAGQVLALRLEAADHLRRRHAGFQELDGDPPPNRGLLLSSVDARESALTDQLQHAIGADPLKLLLFVRGDNRRHGLLTKVAPQSR